jgi:replicative DNA helicase
MSPRSLEAETGILGAVLLTPELVGCLALKPEHFSEAVHQALWAELQARWREQRLIDLVGLREWATKTLPTELGGPVYLHRLCELAAPMRYQVDGYADLLRAMARRRALIDAAQAAIAHAGLREDGDALTELEQRLQEIAAGDLDADAWIPLGEQSCYAVERAELGEAKGVSTGFERLDAITGGLQRGTLWVLGGATSMGKSILMAAVARGIATQGYGVGECHLEMDAMQIGLRTAAALAFDIDHRADNPHYLTAMRGALKREQWGVMRGAAKAAGHLPIYIDPRPGRSLSQIEAAARRLFRKMQRKKVTPGALIVDHEGLIAPESGTRFPSQLEQANARSVGLLAMAKRLDVAVIVASQITKEGSRADGEERLPTAQDLNYGGGISQAAQVVILVHRKAYYAERKPVHLRSPEDEAAIRSREAILVVDKSRGGRRAQVKLWMDPPTAAVWEDAA